jgi:hypothetical protein
MSTYIPQLFKVWHGQALSHRPVTQCFLDLEDSIDGEVDRGNFGEDAVLSLVSFHERSLTETHRARQLIWNEEAIWVFQFRAASSTNTFEHLGAHDNKFTVEEAATRVLVPSSCVVEIQAQIEIDAILWNGKDQTDVLSATSLSTLTPAEVRFPGLQLTFKLFKSEVGSPVKTEVETRIIKRLMEITADATDTDAVQQKRRGATVSFCALDQITIAEEDTRVGGAVDYWVEVYGEFLESRDKDGAIHTALPAAEVGWAVVRSKARHLTATSYSASYKGSATSSIAAP